MTLNKCSDMKLELSRMKGKRNVCEEGDFCAISPNWTYDHKMRRWRHLSFTSSASCLSGSPPHSLDESLSDVIDLEDVCSIHSSSSSESEGRDGHRHSSRPGTSITVSAPTSDEQDTSRSSSRCSSACKTASLDSSFSGPPSPSTTSLEADSFLQEKPPWRKGPTLLRRMERLRGTAGLLSPEQNHRLTQRAGPVLIQDNSSRSSPQTPPTSRMSSSPSSPRTISSSSSAVSTPSPVTRVRSNCKRSNSIAGSGSVQNQQTRSGSEDCRKQTIGSRHSLVFHLPNGHKPGTFPTSLADKQPPLPTIIDSVNWRTGSFHGYRSRHTPLSLAEADLGPASSGNPGRLPVVDNRLSVYDNVPDNPSENEGGSDAERTSEDSEVSQPLAGEDVSSALDGILERISGLQQLLSLWSEDVCGEESRTGSSHDSPAHSSTASSPSSPSHIHLEVQQPEEAEGRSQRRANRRLQRPGQRNLPPLAPGPGLEVLPVSQVVLLQKLALLKLSALMDKNSPSSKQGQSWI